MSFITDVSRRALMASAAAFAASPTLAQPAQVQDRAAIAAAMKRATRYMTDKVSNHGGYVWSYTADFSRCWGEMEAFPTMVWLQAPATPLMGHLFLDALHATGDVDYYSAAAKVGDVLILGQHRSGGWNYMFDLAGEASLKRWYETIGKNGWRLEEFQHYQDNATFDDAVSSDAMQFLLRLYLEKRDHRYRPALDKAIRFVLDSQYPNGGWPQRFPRVEGEAAYIRHVTFNDDVAAENVKFLLMVWQTLGDARVKPAIIKAMDVFLAAQQPAPQAGWGLQHSVADLKPAAARTYEPLALTTHTTVANLNSLMTFYELTGDRKYINRIPEALAWLESVRLPAAQVVNGFNFPTFVELGANKTLTVHRTGSNIVNGRYYADYNPAKPIIHYGQTRRLDVEAVRKRYEALAAKTPEAASAGSPLKSGARPLPAYFSTQDVSVSDLNVNHLGGGGAPTPAEVTAVIGKLDDQGRWLIPLVSASHPYVGDGSPTPAPGDFSQTRVGDATDTSPYITDAPPMGISVGSYVANMGVLIRALDPKAN
jgi:PelA/Pel-15E family pectate lyase